jgi:hypothetical protein
MKGVIAQCLAEMVTTKFGADKWKEVLEKSGLPPSTAFLATSDIDDSAVMNAIKNTCSVLSISQQQAADAFGEYWVCTFAPKIYKAYYTSATNAKDFLLKMDSVHETTTRNIANAHPPRFTYDWKNDNTLIMRYQSNRGLIDFLVSLIKGVGKYFNDNLTVSKISTSDVEVIFA